MMPIVFEPEAWEDYMFWQQSDKQQAKRLDTLIKAVAKSPYEGIGKPEMLKGNYAGFWSRRINNEHRLVYSVKENRLHILQCRFHYIK